LLSREPAYFGWLELHELSRAVHRDIFGEDLAQRVADCGVGVDEFSLDLRSPLEQDQNLGHGRFNAPIPRVAIRVEREPSLPRLGQRSLLHVHRLHRHRFPS